MTPPYDITHAGSSERFKAAAHVALLVTLSPVAYYNVAALIERPSARLWLNTAIYLPLLAFEVKQTLSHLR